MNNFILFKDLTPGSIIYALIKNPDELNYVEGSIVTVGQQRVDMPDFQLRYHNGSVLDDCAKIRHFFQSNESIFDFRSFFTIFIYKICHFVILWPLGTLVAIVKNESSNLKPCSKEAERIQLKKWKKILFFKFGTRDKPYQVTIVPSIVRTSVVPG